MLSKEEIEKAKEGINVYIHDWLDNSTDEDGYEINSIDDDSMAFINNIKTFLQYIQELEEIRGMKEAIELAGMDIKDLVKFKYENERLKNKANQLEQENEELKKGIKRS